MTMAFDPQKFSSLPFPEYCELVYVLCYRRTNAEPLRPFYIGETGRGLGRFGDYQAANFTAATDFKVGKAIQRLRNLGCEVTICYRASVERNVEEQALIASAREDNYPLLNDLPGYNHRTANQADELEKIHGFIREQLGVGYA